MKEECPIERDQQSGFAALDLREACNYRLSELPEGVLTDRTHALKDCFLRGDQRLWGLPFRCGQEEDARDLLIIEGPEAVRIPMAAPVYARYFLFLHMADFAEERLKEDRLFARPIRGTTGLGEHLCDYVLEYEDGTSCRIPIRRRMEISQPGVSMGESSFGCVPHRMPRPTVPVSELIRAGGRPETAWGESQSRVTADYGYPFAYHWIYAMENPQPDKRVAGLSIWPVNGKAILFAITRSEEEEHPLRFLPRAKFALETAAAQAPPRLTIDRGNVISVRPAVSYPVGEWTGMHALKPPSDSGHPARWIVEYAAHPNARIHGLTDRAGGVRIDELATVNGATEIPQREGEVKLVVTDVEGSKLPVRIHVHGENGELLVPANRHRQSRTEWFEDYGADCAERGHSTCYIDGYAIWKLPLGPVYIEVTKGFEYEPVRCVFEVREGTDTLEITLQRRLHWRSKGWMTADTHVHFLSPTTAWLQGKAEDVHVVNVLASQWGELFSNIGDFDGRTTIGEGSDGRGEYLVRVGTENRQAVLGHLSLLGYEGDMILPLSTGGPMESAIGDPLEATLLTWASQGREQRALVILPHFPSPRGEEAAVLLAGLADAIEVCAWSDEHGGISAYSLSDWYRYLNCGYLLPVVGGTDKMSAGAAVGRVRTYSRLTADATDAPFRYEEWKASIRRGETFVTAGPLIEFSVNGLPMGGTIALPEEGGELVIRWEAASVTTSLSIVELVGGGDVVAKETIDRAQGVYGGSWTIRATEPTWLALRIRGHQAGRPETIVAHGSPIAVTVGGKTAFNPVDAASILEQVEAARLYYETLATRSPEGPFEQMRSAMREACRELESKGWNHSHDETRRMKL